VNKRCYCNIGKAEFNGMSMSFNLIGILLLNAMAHSFFYRQDGYELSVFITANVMIF